jgi:hypothetical protein
MKKPFYLVVGQPGTCLHYVASIIKLFDDPHFFDNKPITNKYGMYDAIFCPHILYEGIIRNGKDYPIDTTQDIVNFYQKLLDGTINVVAEYYVESSIGVTHYSDLEFIQPMLNQIPNVEIIFITNDDSHKQRISTNIFVKKYLNNLIKGQMYGNFEYLFLLYLENKNSILFDRERLLSLTADNVYEQLGDVLKYIQKGLTFPFTAPMQHARLHELKLDSVYKTNELIGRIGEIIGGTAHDQHFRFAKEFEHNQVNSAESIVEIIQDIKTSTWSNIFYNQVLGEFAQQRDFNFDRLYALWKKYYKHEEHQQ